MYLLNREKESLNNNKDTSNSLSIMFHKQRENNSVLKRIYEVQTENEFEDRKYDNTKYKIKDVIVRIEFTVTNMIIINLLCILIFSYFLSKSIFWVTKIKLLKY